MNEKSKFGAESWVVFFSLAIILSIISQVNNDSVVLWSRPASYVVWFTCFVILLNRNRYSLAISKEMKYFIIVYSLFIIYYLFSLFLNKDFVNSNYILPLSISFFCYCNGSLLYASKAWSEKKLKFLLIIYVISVSLLALQIHITFFPSFSTWTQSLVYLYSRKNSAGQIICMSILIILYAQFYKKNTIVKWGHVAYLSLVLFLIQSRASVISLVFSVIMMELLVKKKNRMKKIVCLLGFIIILYNTPLRYFFDKVFLLSKYQGTDLNTFSSGRLGLWAQAFSLFRESPFLGVGNHYVDNFFIGFLTEYGIIGFIIVVPFIFYKLIRVISISLRKKSIESVNSNYGMLITSISFFYIMESIFEAIPPLGPGVCAFLFWLLLGFADARLGSKTRDINFLYFSTIKN
ncbi:O-antigen ligase family protein [Enterococcus avium]|uniref:O-antigen ligase family protein n=1 Tax=Enterococcus avium TaxID=33945 RepID=UPI00346378B3